MCCGGTLVPQTSRVDETKVPACGMQLMKIWCRFVMESIHSNNFLNKSADLSSVCSGGTLVPQTSRLDETKVPGSIILEFVIYLGFWHLYWENSANFQTLQILVPLLSPNKQCIPESIHPNNFLNKSADLSSVCCGGTLVPQTSRAHETKVPTCGMWLMKTLQM